MSYREDQRRKAIGIRDGIFRDPGGGLFSKKEREFVLQDPSLNLWAGIRTDAINYFDRNSIQWWKEEDKNEPTGHLLSSQVACINHLYFIRQRKDMATKILQAVSDPIEEAVIVDDGYVEFEANGAINYLAERAHTRGANSTSVDAIMVGKKGNGKNTLFLIEWKYTETYARENKYIARRSKLYDKLLSDPECPIATEDFESLYYEPYYQLMRQTLLGWKMVQAREYNCDEYIHLHIIPEENKELKDTVTSPKLSGSNMSKAWKNVLRQPEKYQIISPESFIRPADVCLDTATFISYLEKRYWE
jgi:hypothetical protein